MNGRRRMFTKKNIIILSAVLFAILLTTSIAGILLVRFSGPILFVGYGVIGSFQDTARQDRLLCIMMTLTTGTRTMIRPSITC